MFERTKDIQLSIIKQIEIRAAKLPDSISLAQGVPDFDTPECIKGRAIRAIERGETAKYSLSPGMPELRELIETSLSREGMFYDWQKEIIITVGAIEAITATIIALTNPGDEVLIPEPTYTSYKQVIKLAGCTPVFVPLDESKGWAFDLEKYQQAITPKTKVIFYCNPNNPTGTIYTKEQLLGLARLATENNLFLVSDDVYKDFIFDDTELFSLAQLPELRKKLVRIFSFSKSYALTGWRVGYLHSDESIISEILKVHDSLVTCASTVSQYAAMGALEMADENVKIFNNEFKKRRDLICGRLDKLSHVFTYIRPNSSYYVFPKIILPNKQNSWEFSLELLENAGVATVPGFAFGPNGEGHIRLSFGRSENDINKAFDRLDKYFL